MDYLSMDAITQLAGQMTSHLGIAGLDHLGQTASRLGLMLERGLDVQSSPPLPATAPSVPVTSEILPNASGIGAASSGATMGEKPSLSAWSMFWQADIIVKMVMLTLVGASIWSWTIIFEKVVRLRDLNKKAEQFEEKFWSGGSLEDLFDRIGQRPRDPMTAVFVAAMREWRHSAQRRNGAAGPRAMLAQRVERVMGITQNRELETLERRLGFLASTGAVAPFVGLFGTVWGIMNSFHAIGMSNDTSLATVAPGIAEALFATALGLVAAIPAVIAYNKLSADIDRYAGRLEAFSGEFGAILGRQLDERE
ncbi:protein TolQ [Rhodospirillum rubrum]|nr:protein TolQ [Rhodospirillum rubrum]MBK1676284.1 protein TolQ [Rhodospirillum rubrum]